MAVPQCESLIAYKAHCLLSISSGIAVYYRSALLSACKQPSNLNMPHLLPSNEHTLSIPKFAVGREGKVSAGLWRAGGGCLVTVRKGSDSGAHQPFIISRALPTINRSVTRGNISDRVKPSAGQMCLECCRVLESCRKDESVAPWSCILLVLGHMLCYHGETWSLQLLWSTGSRDVLPSLFHGDLSLFSLGWVVFSAVGRENASRERRQGHRYTDII